MDQRSQEYFDKILKKEPETLTEDEIGFLRARQSYLKKAQIEEYDNILNPKVKSQTSEKETVKQDANPQKTN